MDKYKIDSHKLIYHVARVNHWLKNNEVYPIYAEISPCGACNHRCIYCALDFMEYQPKFLDSALLKKRLSEMAVLGVKSVMYAGEGEPLLHRDISGIVNHTKASGIDVAITTNGVLMNKDFIDKCLGKISWIKISINGATKNTYSRIHRANPGDFGELMDNLSYALKQRRKLGYKCVIGFQLLLIPENAKEVVLLARKAKLMGVDYLVVKPYSQHPSSKTTRYKNIKYKKYLYLADRLNSLNNAKFNCIFRLNTMRKWDEPKRNYKHCLALPFWSYIDAGGNVWACSVYLGKTEFTLGNIYNTSFQRIWEGQKKKKLFKMAAEKLDTKNCRVNCRMDEINRYLWELKHPPEHVNFI